MGDSRKESTAITLPLDAAPDPPRAERGLVVLVVLLGAAGATLVSPVSALVRAVALGALLALAVVLAVVRRSFARRPAHDRRASILVDARGIWRTRADGEAACVARWDEPFGVTLLSNPSRTRALFAFSSPERTRLVAVLVDNAQAADAARFCLAHAVPVTDADLDDALGGLGTGLSGKSAAVLFAELEKRAAAAIGRIYLSDAGGAKVTLESDKLCARDKLIDLADPLEWRSFTFHEGGIGLPSSAGARDEGPPAGSTLYHATWARQGPTELVLVCPIPTEASSWGIRSADPPPPRELRVAVDRLFMIPLRKALEGAPRISRAGAARRSGSQDDIRT